MLISGTDSLILAARYYSLKLNLTIMDFKQIQELIKLVNKSNLSELTIEEKDFKVTIRQKDEIIQQTVISGQFQSAPALAAAAASAPAIAAAPAAPTTASMAMPPQD